ncbi:MAG TPA: hypothetical protein VHK88_00020 [Aquihabitans sp.]|jgi:hypothetical protein|nr:hypothetical protein [Aquihabitans sp.]
MSTIISVQLDALEALATELRLLAGELEGDAARCSQATGALLRGLSHDEGLNAVWAASTWGTLVAAVAEGTRAVSGALSAAASSYRAVEEARGAAIGRLRTPYPRMTP